MDLKEKLAREIHTITVNFAGQHGKSTPKSWDEMRETAREHYRNLSQKNLTLIAEAIKNMELPKLPKAYQNDDSNWLNPVTVAYLEGQQSIVSAILKLFDKE